MLLLGIKFGKACFGLSLSGEPPVRFLELFWARVWMKPLLYNDLFGRRSPTFIAEFSGLKLSNKAGHEKAPVPGNTSLMSGAVCSSVNVKGKRSTPSCAIGDSGAFPVKNLSSPAKTQKALRGSRFGSFREFFAVLVPLLELLGWCVTSRSEALVSICYLMIRATAEVWDRASKNYVH